MNKSPSDWIVTLTAVVILLVFSPAFVSLCWFVGIIMLLAPVLLIVFLFFVLVVYMVMLSWEKAGGIGNVKQLRQLLGDLCLDIVRMIIFIILVYVLMPFDVLLNLVFQVLNFGVEKERQMEAFEVISWLGRSLISQNKVWSFADSY